MDHLLEEHDTLATYIGKRGYTGNDQFYQEMLRRRRLDYICLVREWTLKGGV